MYNSNYFTAILHCNKHVNADIPVYFFHILLKTSSYVLTEGEEEREGEEKEGGESPFSLVLFT